LADANGALNGTLLLNAQDIWVADAATIALLRSDPFDPDIILTSAAPGSTDPLGYVRANAMQITVGNSLLVRNTSPTGDASGLLVGNVLTIIPDNFNPQAPGQITNPLRVLAYGRRLLPDGTFVTGDAFFAEVNFFPGGITVDNYATDATFNNCNIRLGCAPPPPPSSERPPLQVNNPNTLMPPPALQDAPPPGAGQQDAAFGIDFPEMPESSIIKEDPMLDEAVTSGGDASLYGGTEEPAKKDEEN
jgi:hypothetical protein